MSPSISPFEALLAYPFDRERNRTRRMYLVIFACVLLGIAYSESISYFRHSVAERLTYGLLFGSKLLIVCCWFQCVSGIADVCKAVPLQTVPGLKWRAAVTVLFFWILLTSLQASHFGDDAVFEIAFWAAIFCLTRQSRFLAGFALLLLAVTIIMGPAWEYLKYFYPRSTLGQWYQWHIEYAFPRAAALLAFIAFLRFFPLLSAAFFAAWVAFAQWAEPLVGTPYWKIEKSVKVLAREDTHYWIVALVMMAMVLYGLIGRPARRKFAPQQLAWASPSPGLLATIRRELFSGAGTSLPPLPGYYNSLKAALSKGSEPAHLLIFGMGRALHASTVTWVSIFYITMAGILLIQSFNTLDPDDMPHEIRSICMALTFAFVPACIVPIRLAAYRLRREQALLCIAPQTPRGSALTRLFATAIVSQMLRMWLVSLVITAAMVGIARVEWDAATIPVALASLLLLSGLAYLAQDFSRMTNPGTFSIQPLLAIVPTFLVFYSVLMLKWPFIWLGVPVAMTAIALLVWRGHAMLRGPQAWPVGRLA